MAHALPQDRAFERSPSGSGTVVLPVRVIETEFLGELKTTQQNYSWTRSGGLSSIFNNRVTYVFNDATTFVVSSAPGSIPETTGFTNTTLAFAVAGTFTACEHPHLALTPQRKLIAAELVALTGAERRFNDENAKVGEVNGVVFHGSGRVFLRALSPVISVPDERGESGFVLYMKGYKGKMGRGDVYEGVGISTVCMRSGHIAERRLGEIFGPSEPSWGSTATLVHDKMLYLYGHFQDASTSSESRETYLARVSLVNGSYKSQSCYSYWAGDRFATRAELLTAQKELAPVMHNAQSGAIFHTHAFASLGSAGTFVFIGSRSIEDSILRLSFARYPWGPFSADMPLLDLSKTYAEQQRRDRGCRNSARKYMFAHPQLADLRNGELVVSWTDPFPTQVHMAKLRLECGGVDTQTVLEDVQRRSRSGEAKLEPEIEYSLQRFNEAAELDPGVADRGISHSIARRRGARPLTIFPCVSGPLSTDRKALRLVHVLSAPPTLSDQPAPITTITPAITTHTTTSYHRLAQLWNLQEITNRTVPSLSPDAVAPILQIRYNLRSRRLLDRVLLHDAEAVEAEEKLREGVFERVWNHIDVLRGGWRVDVEIMDDDEEEEYGGYDVGQRRGKNGAYSRDTYVSPRYDRRFAPSKPAPVKPAPVQHREEDYDSDCSVDSTDSGPFPLGALLAAGSVHPRPSRISTIPARAARRPSFPLAWSYYPDNTLPSHSLNYTVPSDPGSETEGMSEEEAKDEGKGKGKAKRKLFSRKGLKAAFRDFKERMAGPEVGVVARKLIISGPVPLGVWEKERAMRREAKKEAQRSVRGVPGEWNAGEGSFENEEEGRDRKEKGKGRRRPGSA
ncbi:hypothetical protein EDC01DRAFT_286915 [Geopyxis carbonaria]|nr:hypothetical protein EDC01DRAFT_286915 [Geopyxis carbonaria]